MPDAVVYYAGNTQHNDAQRADGQTGARVVVAAEGSDGGIVRIDVHGLHHLEVVEQGDDGVEQGYEYQ